MTPSEDASIRRAFGAHATVPQAPVSKDEIGHVGAFSGGGNERRDNAVGVLEAWLYVDDL